MDLMDILVGRKSVQDVFTPRRPEVNETMYIHRPKLEKSLLRAINGSQHVLLFGESGNGKSWLYKKVLDGVVPVVSANCANASRVKSLTAEIVSVATPVGLARKTGYTEGKSAELSALAASANIHHQADYELIQKESLLAAFEHLSGRAGGKTTVVVLENLESIFDDKDRMGELANILLLLDDPRYAGFRIKFLIVGTPSGVLDYFTRIKNMESVSNRIVEVDKVEGFVPEQVEELVRKGFVKELRIQMTDDEVSALARQIFHVTMGVAQRVHEYCEQLAYAIEDSDWKYHPDLTATAESAWLSQGLRQSYTIVENSLNSRDTAIARRNQVIYSIGKIKTHQFYTSDIEELIRRDFPTTVPETNMGVGSILSELARGADCLLVRNEKTGQFRVRDPRYVMCIRVVLFKDRASGKVAKRNFKSG